MRAPTWILSPSVWFTNPTITNHAISFCILSRIQYIVFYIYYFSRTWNILCILYYYSNNILYGYTYWTTYQSLKKIWMTTKHYFLSWIMSNCGKMMNLNGTALLRFEYPCTIFMWNWFTKICCSKNNGNNNNTRFVFFVFFLIVLVLVLSYRMTTRLYLFVVVFFCFFVHALVVHTLVPPLVHVDNGDIEGMETIKKRIIWWIHDYISTWYCRCNKNNNDNNDNKRIIWLLFCCNGTLLGYFMIFYLCIW